MVERPAHMGDELKAGQIVGPVQDNAVQSCRLAFSERMSTGLA
jgi:hypothetical protein